MVFLKYVRTPLQGGRWWLTRSKDEVCIHLTPRVLGYEDVRDVAASLGPASLGGEKRINVDLTHVRDIERPWTPVFALIVQWAQSCGVPFRLTGLNRRLAAMASLVRQVLRMANITWRSVKPAHRNPRNR
jgi:hypothetical protein